MVTASAFGSYSYGFLEAAPALYDCPTMHIFLCSWKEFEGNIEGQGVGEDWRKWFRQLLASRRSAEEGIDRGRREERRRALIKVDMASEIEKVEGE